MHTLDGEYILEHHIALVETQKINYAHFIMHDFFVMYPDNDAQEYLWFNLHCALKAEIQELKTIEIDRMLHFYDCLLLVLGAAKSFKRNPKE